MTAATSTLTVEINARQAIVTLQDIKRNTENTTSAIDKLRAASSGGFDKLEAAINKAVGAIDRMHATLSAMAAGMGAGVAAAVKQTTALDRLAQSVKSVDSAQAKAAQSRQNDLAAARSWEAQLTKELGLRERIRRQLAGDSHAGVRDQLGEQLTGAMAAYQAALTKFGTNSKEGVAAKGALSREFTLVSSKIAEINGLLPTLDRGFEKTAKGWASMSKMDRLQLQSNAINFTQQTIASGGAGQALMVQGPELIALAARYPTVLLPAAAAFTAVAGAVGLFGVAIARASNENQRLVNLSVGIRASGQEAVLSSANLAKLAHQLNDLPGVSRDAADALATNLSRVRGLGADATTRIAKLSPDYAAAIGEKDVVKAGSDLAKMLQDPGKAAAALADTMGLLSAAQTYNVKRMADQGRGAEALGVVLTALEKTTKGMANDTMGAWSHATDSLSNAWSRLMDKLADTSAIKGAASAIRDLGDALAGTLGDEAASKRLFERSFPADFRSEMLRRAKQAQQQPGVLSLPMPPALLAQQPTAVAPGGAIDGRKELSDVISMADGYRGWRGEAEKLSDMLERVRRAQKLAVGDPDALRLLRQAESGILDAQRSAQDPKTKMVLDAQRGASNEWRVTNGPWQDRDRMRTVIEAENTAREAGLSGMQREALVREKLSELSAKGLMGIQDSVREMGYQSNAQRQLAAADGQGIVAQQAATDAITKQTFARSALSKASNDNIASILKEIDAYNGYVDAQGKASVESQFRQRARAASPTISYNEALRDAPGTAKYMESMGATGEEIKRYYEDIELSKLNASRNWLDGVKRQNIEYQRSTSDAATAAAKAFSTSADAMTDSLTDFVTTGKLSVGDFVNTVSRQFASMAIQKTVTAPLFGWMSDGLGTLFNANGNAFSPAGKLHTFAKGGAFTNSIVSSPTLFKFAKGTGLMGEAGPEAIMPLKRAADGSLGVRADMSPLAYGPEAAAQVVDASQAINVTTNNTITVNGSASGNTEADAEFATEIARQVSKQFEGSVKAIIADQLNRAQKPGGMMNRLR